MIKQYIIENWLVKPAQHDMEHITRSQIQAAWARILFSVASMIYVSQHAIFYAEFRIQIILLFGSYLIYNACSIIAIRKFPLSAFRMLFAPIMDTIIICTGMLADGGLSSGMFYILFLPVIGNSFRFGNALMVYTQMLSLIGLGGISYISMHMQIEPDHTLLIWQFFGLLSIPFYVFLIREKAEKAIRGQAEAEKTSETVLDKGPLPVFTYELDEHNHPRILYANAAISEIFPDSYTTLVGQQPDLLTVVEDGAEIINFCRSTLSSDQANENTAQSIYIRGRDKRGNLLKLLCNTSRLRWREQWIGICYILDITERERLQKQLDAMQRHGFMSTLVAGIVHDFRNVLTNIIGYAEVMHMSSSDYTSKEQLSEIINAGERGSNLITHLLKLSKNNISTISESYTKGAQMEQPLDNIIGLARLQLPAHVQLHSNIHVPLHDVAISMIEIEQILLNLINNSIQALDGPGHIQVNIRNVYEHFLAVNGQPAFCIEVEDDGVGIAKENLDKIFDPFWTSREEKGGSGLGLTMIKRIVKLHHGNIHVESSPHQGACFTIHLPPYTEEETAESNEGIPTPDTNKVNQLSAIDKASYHILLVDDVPTVLEIHKAMLTHIRHTSSSAKNGKQALDLFLQNDQHFDMIITDYHMPIMDGLELIKAVRQHDVNIPILMITAFGEDEKLQGTENLSAQLMNKPIKLEELRATIVEMQKKVVS